MAATLLRLLPAALALIPVSMSSSCAKASARGIEAVDEAPQLLPHEPGPVDPTQSAAVVVGVENFKHDVSLAPVTFAVDDAIDFSYRIAVDLGLLPPERLLLLLAGDPDKPESQARLSELTILGAEMGSAFLTDIYPAIERQANLVGPNGILFVFFATHGYSEGAAHLLLAADSQLRYRTGVTADRVLEASQGKRGGLRLFVLDACRGQIQQSRGESSGADWRHPRSTLDSDFPRTLSAPNGYIVISASSPGEVAIPGNGNGLLTEVLLEGLRCGLPSEVEGFVTLEGLKSFLMAEVSRRSNGQQRPEVRSGEGLSNLRLIRCGSVRTPPDSLDAAEILEPKNGASVGSRSVIRVRAPAGLYARAVIQVEGKGTYYTQSPEAEAIAVPTSGVALLPVQFGSPDQFVVHVGLTESPELLRGVAHPTSLPQRDSQKRPVIWLEPVFATFKASNNPQD